MPVFSRRLCRLVICSPVAAVVDMPLQVQLMPLLAAAALQSCTNILAFVDTGWYFVDATVFPLTISHQFPRNKNL